MAWHSFISTPAGDIYNSFKNTPGGFSGRKLSACWSVVVASFLSWKNTTPENAVLIIGLWLLAAAVFLCIVTIPNLIKILAILKREVEK